MPVAGREGIAFRAPQDVPPRPNRPERPLSRAASRSRIGAAAGGERSRSSLIAALVAAIAGGATYFSSRGHGAATAQSAPKAPTQARATSAFRSRLPAEIRGVHVTEGLASIPGKIETLLRARVARAEHDRARRQGRERLRRLRRRGHAGAGPQKIGAARPYYDAKKVVREAHRAGIYLIGRVVVFQDPTLTAGDPGLGIQSKYGGVWKTSSGWGWANEYDPRVWKYDTDVAVAAAKAGFDEIQFDYVRFPTDGDLSRSSTRTSAPSRARRRSTASSSTPSGACIRSACASRPTCSASPRRATSGSVRRRTGSARCWTRSTRWSTRRTTTRASTT